jgi:UDP-N-acetylglucosamine 2-epimerase
MTNPVTLNEKASHAEEYVSGLLEAEQSDATLHFVIKLHPNESDIAFYERIRDRVGARNVTVIKELDTPQLLFDADVVVTTISTTGEEAIFLGKPLVVVNLTNEPDFMPYVGSPAAITVRERSQLEPALREALTDSDSQARLREGRKAYVAEHFLSDDGNSSVRCAELIRGLLAARGPAGEAA